MPPKPVFAESNVREVLAALDDETTAVEESMTRSPPRREASDPWTLSDAQLLRLLETRRGPGAREQAADASAAAIPLLMPEDQFTRQSLREALARNIPVFFAVQVQKSLQLAALDKSAALAKFSAYTVYTIEGGSRNGRKWYALRIGFFNDVRTAKQVAYQVRRQFAQVAVLPVSPRERAAPAQIAAKATAPARLAVAAPAAARPTRRPASLPRPSASGSRRAASAPSAGRKPDPGFGEQESLEETLEILGVNVLDAAIGTGAASRRGGFGKSTTLSRLFGRLGDRLRR